MWYVTFEWSFKWRRESVWFFRSLPPSTGVQICSRRESLQSEPFARALLGWTSCIWSYFLLWENFQMSSSCIFDRHSWSATDPFQDVLWLFSTWLWKLLKYSWSLSTLVQIVLQQVVPLPNDLSPMPPASAFLRRLLFSRSVHACLQWWLSGATFTLYSHSVCSLVLLVPTSCSPVTAESAIIGVELGIPKNVRRALFCSGTELHIPWLA